MSCVFVNSLFRGTNPDAVIRELFSLGREYDELELFSLEYLEEVLPGSVLDKLFSILTLDELFSS